MAVEKHHGRAKALAENCERLGATSVTVREEDAADVDGEFDRVLLDPPCSDLGTLQSRPDVRWKKEEGMSRGSPPSRRACWTQPRTASRPGGHLVYSTCTISPDENERQIASFAERRGDFRLDDLPDPFGRYAHPTADEVAQVLPHRHGTDGFFIARLVKEG